jgi:hypothetical protein
MLCTRGLHSLVARCGFWIAVVSVSGCVGPLVPVVEVDSTTAERLRREIRVVDSQESSRHYVRLGPISALSCKNKLWDPAATEEDAINQLLFRAELMGASALSAVRCQANEETSLETNCWSSVACKGEALRGR